MGTGARRRQRTHRNGKHIKKKYRTKRREKDLDQIHTDMEKESEITCKAAPHSKVDIDLPGAGKHYCITCARHFITDSALEKHLKSKPHKRRLRALQEPAYTAGEADRAAGQGSYQLPPSNKMLK